MKYLRIVSLLILSVLAISSCSTTIVKTKSSPKSAPPGQVKKSTGSKSAAPYAPGQKKKKD